MPQIVKRGVDPREAKYRMKCDCGTEALFARHELQHDQREHDSWVVCPVCSKSHTVKFGGWEAC
jgi:hypothetical protein